MRMVIFKRERVLQMELHGLLDNRDARILYQECSRLIEEGYLKIHINLARISRISDQVFDSFRQIHELFQEAGGTCTFVAPQPKLKQMLLALELDVQVTETAGEKELASELAALQ